MTAILRPALDARLYDNGALGWPLEESHDFYDIPAKAIHKRKEDFGHALKEWEYDTSQRVGGNFDETNVLVEGKLNVVTPRPFKVDQNTPLNKYNQFGGTWEETLCLEPPRRVRLFQRSAAKNTVYRLESLYFLHQNPSICFTVQRLQAHHENNNTAYPPKIQVTIADQWMVRFSNGQDAGIWRKVGGRWRQDEHIALTAKDKEVTVFFMVRRGAVMFSFDEGEKWYVARDETPIIVPALGQVVIEGVSCQMLFGFHQLYFENCWYETYDITTYEIKYGTPRVDLSQTLRPPGTSIAVSFLPSPAATLKYRVTMRPKTIINANISFPLFLCPEVWSTNIGWDAVLHAPVTSYTELGEADLGIVDHVKIQEESKTGKDFGVIGGRSGSIVLTRDPGDALTGYFGFRLLAIDFGYYLAGGGVEMTARCVMQVIQPKSHSSRTWETELELELEDLMERLSACKVDDGWRPLDGMTVIQARLYVMAKAGIAASFCDFLDTGKVLPDGRPDHCYWWPKQGQNSQELFDAFDVYEDTESFVSSTGIFTSRPARWTDNFDSFEIDAKGIADPMLRGEDIEYCSHHTDVRTAVLVEGEDPRHFLFWATDFNYNQERNPALQGFVGQRRWELYLKEKVMSLAEAIIIAQSRHRLIDVVPQLPQIKIPGKADTFRGQRFTAINFETDGLNPTDKLRVEGLDFEWSKERKSTKTTIRARRVA